MLRRYAEFPAMFVPDVGEVVVASLSPAGPWLRAVITKTRRASRGSVRVDFVWLEGTGPTVCTDGWEAGTKGHVYLWTTDTVPLIRRVPKAPAE
jgi:hypothetical protein